MDSKQAILEAATELIYEKGEQISSITVRDICKRAGVGLGLLNYHFGTKDVLIDLCVEKIINGIIAKFTEIQKESQSLDPMDKLLFLGNMTFSFLFEHEAISRISILSDLAHPQTDDNTHRTFDAYVPLVAACRPKWSEKKIKEKTFYLITLMQQSFLRYRQISVLLNIDFSNPEQRRAYHKKIVQELLEEGLE